MLSAPTNTHAGAQRGVTSSRSHSTPTSPGKGPSSSPLRRGARKYQPSVDPAPGAAQAALAGTGEPWSPPSRGATRATAVQLPGQLPAEARRAGLVLRNSRDLPGVCRAHRARGRPGARGQHWCRSRGDVPVRCVCVNPASPCSCPVPGIPTSPSDGAWGHVPGLHRRRVGLRCCGCTRDLGQGHPAGERSDASRDAGGILARSGWEGQKEAGEAVETHGHPRVRGLVLGFPGATVLVSDANVPARGDHAETSSPSKHSCWGKPVPGQGPWDSAWHRSPAPRDGHRAGRATAAGWVRGQPRLLDTPHDHGRKIRPK